MKAMVFAAGLGTRLRPLTDDRPKALVEIAGKTMLERVIQKLIAHGICDITVNVHHFAHKIQEFLESRNNFGIDIHISDESSLLLDTGAGILAAREYLDGDEPILIHNADILTDFDIDQMREQHQQLGSMATLLVKDRKTSRYLLMSRDESHAMRGWTNVNTHEVKPASLDANDPMIEPLAFGGVHIIEPQMLRLLAQYAVETQKAKITDGQTTDLEPFSIIPFYIWACQENRINGFMPKSAYSWHDIGKIETLQAAELEMLSQEQS